MTPDEQKLQSVQRWLTVLFATALGVAVFCCFVFPPGAALLAIGVGVLQLLWKREVEQHLATMTELHTTAHAGWREALDDWKKAIAHIERMSTTHAEAMWGVVCVLTNLLDMTPWRARREVEEAQRIWQQKHPTN